MTLSELKDYWIKKYPTVNISLWTNEDESIYSGMMNGREQSVDLNATTIGELISQGEAFLRKLM